jgi:hypothetical protein
MNGTYPLERPGGPRLLLILWGVCLLGLLIRLWLADHLYPMTAGDPLYSYTYRALLIAEGRWEGVFLMWHPPGYPLLLGGLSAATLGSVPPYWCGVAVSLACYVGLFWVVDRLAAPRVRYPGTRIVVGSFVALYETLFLWSTCPLTEPVYLLAVFGVVLLLDRDRPSLKRVTTSGLILGAAFTVRLEAVAPTVGIGVYLVARAFRAGGWSRAATTAAGFAGGWFVAAGWLLTHWEYLRVCAAAQRYSYTIPPATGAVGNVMRLAECVYHAVTVWLPFALLLPYWLLAGAGLTHRASAAGRPVLHLLLLAVVVPSLAAVGWTIMHKRTASFLLPAAAIWVGFGVETLARRWVGHRPRLVWLLIWLAVAANLVQAARIGFFVRKEIPPREAPDCVAAGVLKDAGATPGLVWAFGSEPDVYALCGWPLVYPYFEREAGYDQAYADHAGNPAGFVAELRRRDFQYLVFALAPTAEDRIEKQPFSPRGSGPLRSDLEQIVAAPARFGLDDFGSRPADRGRVRVHVFRIR